MAPTTDSDDPTILKNTSKPAQEPFEPSLNPKNPYYLNPGENPSATIVAPPLDDNNYHN